MIASLPSQSAGLTLQAPALSPQEDLCNQTAPKLSLLAVSVALPFLSQLCLHAKTRADFQCPPTPPLPFSLPIIFFKGGKRSLVLPPLSPLRRLQHFLEGMLQFLSRLEVLSPSPVRALGAAAAPALISGGQRSHKRVPGAGEMRQVAGRDHAGEGPSLQGLPGPPALSSFPVSFQQSHREAALAASRHSCSACPVLLFFYPAKIKSP